MIFSTGLFLGALATFAPTAPVAPGETGETAPLRPGDSSPAAERCIRLLRDSRLPGAPSTDELVQALRCDAPAACPALVDLLVAGQVPALEESERPQSLSVPQRDLVLDALAALPAGELVAQAQRLLAPEGDVETDERPPPAVRGVASRLLALGAGCGGLAEILALATPEDGQPADRKCLEALEWSIGRVLARDGRTAHQALESSLGGLPQVLMPSILRALGDDGDPAGLVVVLKVAERFPGERVQAFAQARRLGASEDPQVNAWLARLLRQHLDPSEPNLARAAALVLGELSDFECIEGLIELLGDSPASSEAHWALTRISGLSLAPDRARWRHWLAGELAFFAEEYEACLRNLHGPHRGRAVAAIRELSRHRLHRHEVARELALALEAAPASRRRLLCNALEALGSRPAAPALVPLLEDRDPVVVDAAWRALRTLTGMDLPRDVAAWEAALGDSPAAAPTAGSRAALASRVPGDG